MTRRVSSSFEARRPRSPFAALALVGLASTAAACSDTTSPLTRRSTDAEVGSPDVEDLGPGPTDADRDEPEAGPDPTDAGLEADADPDDGGFDAADVGDAGAPTWALVGVQSGMLVAIDRTDATVSDIAPFSEDVQYLAYDAFRSVLFGLQLQTRRLYQIEPCSAASRLVGTIEVPGVELGVAESLAIDDATGLMVAGVSFDEGGTSETLVELDPRNFVGGVVGRIAGTGQDDADRLFFADGTLYATDSFFTPPFRTGLYRIDLGGGAATLIAETTPQAHGKGLAHDPSTGRTFLSDPDADQLYTIDLETAALTAVGPLTDVEAIAAVERGCE